MTTIDRRELTPSFELLGRYLAPILDLRFFLPLKRFLFVGYPIAFLALLHCLIFFFRCHYDTLAPGIFDTFALLSVQECKECMGGNY